jgi:hypothetical protein
MEPKPIPNIHINKKAWEFFGNLASILPKSIKSKLRRVGAIPGYTTIFLNLNLPSGLQMISIYLLKEVRMTMFKPNFSGYFPKFHYTTNFEKILSVNLLLAKSSFAALSILIPSVVQVPQSLVFNMLEQIWSSGTSISQIL